MWFATKKGPTHSQRYERIIYFNDQQSNGIITQFCIFLDAVCVCRAYTKKKLYYLSVT